MRTQSTTQADSTFQPLMPWRAVLVEALPNLKLRVRFVDGTEGAVDLTALVNSPDAGVFAILADPSVFNEAFIQ
jgi:hypothetical protein